MLELSPSGSVRGVPSNGHPYRDPRPIPVITCYGANGAPRQAGLDWHGGSNPTTETERERGICWGQTLVGLFPLA